jgi:hypothetical protein
MSGPDSSGLQPADEGADAEDLLGNPGLHRGVDLVVEERRRRRQRFATALPMTPRERYQALVLSVSMTGSWFKGASSVDPRTQAPRTT